MGKRLWQDDRHFQKFPLTILEIHEFLKTHSSVGLMHDTIVTVILLCIIGNLHGIYYQPAEFLRLVLCRTTLSNILVKPRAIYKTEGGRSLTYYRCFYWVFASV